MFISIPLAEFFFSKRVFPTSCSVEELYYMFKNAKEVLHFFIIISYTYN